MHTRLSFLFALFLTACIGPLDPDNSEYIEIREVTVGPALARCYGVGEQTCMIVDGLLFYDGIEGFNFEAGYNYRLRIGIYDPYDGEEPPQDAGQYSYRLLEQIEKAPAPSTPATISVGPTRVKEEITVGPHRTPCGAVYCNVVNGEAFLSEIVNFQPRHNYSYRLRVERFDMFSSSTTPPSSNIPTYGYRWLETLDQSANN